MRSFPLRFFTAEKPFFTGECESLVVPTPEGAYGIMAGHSNLVLAIAAGELKYREKDSAEFIETAVTPGLMVVKNGAVTVLVEAAERDSDIDFARAMKQYEHAKEDMLMTENESTKRLAEAKMARALARLKVRSKLK